MIVPYRRPSFDVAVPATAHSLSGFREWIASGELPDEVTAHLVEREIFIEMSPERIETHSLVKYEIGCVVGRVIKKSKLGAVYPDGVWLTNDDADLSTEADACFATWDSHRSGRVVLTSPAGDDADKIELRGSPDWVLEVVGPHSVKKDTRLLPIAYYRASVAEFWLVDARSDDVRFTIFVRGENEFVAVEPVKGWVASPLFDKRFRLVRRENPVGGWEYELRVR